MFWVIGFGPARDRAAPGIQSDFVVGFIWPIQLPGFIPSRVLVPPHRSGRKNLNPHRSIYTSTPTHSSKGATVYGVGCGYGAG